MCKTTIFAALISAALLSAGAMAMNDDHIIRTSKPGGSYRAFLQDKRDCIRMSWVRLGGRGAGYGREFNATMALHCMADRGYVIDPHGYALKLPG